MTAPRLLPILAVLTAGLTLSRPAFGQADPAALVREFQELVTRPVAPADQAARNTAVAGFTTFRATDLAGRPIAPEDYRGRVLLIDFWATWCGPCLEEMPNVVRAYETWHGQGSEIIGVSLDRAGAEEQIRTVMREQGMTWRQVYDGRFWQAEVAVLNNIHSIPATFLLDRSGKVRYANLRGAELERRVRELIAEPPPEK